MINLDDKQKYLEALWELNLLYPNEADKEIYRIGVDCKSYNFYYYIEQCNNAISSLVALKVLLDEQNIRTNNVGLILDRKAFDFLFSLEKNIFQPSRFRPSRFLGFDIILIERGIEE